MVFALMIADDLETPIDPDTGEGLCRASGLDPHAGERGALHCWHLENVLDHVDPPSENGCASPFPDEKSSGG